MSAIVERSPYLSKLPNVVAWLKEYLHVNSDVESFFISVTHVGIVRPQSDHRLPAILVAGKQIFATHYVEGGLGLKDHVERQAPLIVRGLRARPESGDPPDEASDLFSDTHPGVH